MKNIIKGYAVWILNNALLLTLNIHGRIAFVTPSAKNIITTSVVALLWFITGHMIVSMFYVKKIETIKLEPIGVAKKKSDKEDI